MHGNTVPVQPANADLFSTTDEEDVSLDSNKDDLGIHPKRRSVASQIISLVV